MNSRHVFHIETDTGTWSQVSSPFMGTIRQIRWAPDEADTGATLDMVLLPNESDTGDGFTFVSQADASAAFVDTGISIVGAGDRFRVAASPGGSGLSGRLYVWVRG